MSCLLKLYPKLELVVLLSLLPDFFDVTYWNLQLGEPGVKNLTRAAQQK